MAQDRRYDLTGTGSEGDPQLGSMSTQPPVVPGTPVPPVVPLPPSTNGTGGGKSTFSEKTEHLIQGVSNPNVPTHGSLFSPEFSPFAPVAPPVTPPLIPTEQQLNKPT